MTSDKMDLHYQQQLSALMDGDLSADEARFLLRRLQHDTELNGCWERWQLCGDVLRGQAQAPAPAGFAERVAAGIAAQTTESVGEKQGASRRRGPLRLWGGGALAASVAAIALFMAGQRLPEEAPVVAATAPTSGPVTSGMADSGRVAAGTQAAQAAAAAAASVAVASVPRRQEAAARRGGSATRTQQAASRSVGSARLPERSVASVASAAVPVVHAIANAPVAAARDPFSNVQISSPGARPWPRAVLPQYPTGNGAFNTGFSTERASQTFYPFEPRATDVPPVRLPEPALRE